MRLTNVLAVRWMTGLLSCAILASACGVSATRGVDDLGRGGVQSELKITKVVLYQSGVGYFERRGRIHSNVLTLRIRPDQVMDVLKSLTVVDARKGQAVTVSLPAEKSRLESISQLPPQVRTSGGVLAIAQAFRGATAIVRSDRGTSRGRIVGVENLGQGPKPDWRLTLLEGGTLSSHRVSQIRSLKVLDSTLTVGLEKSLDFALNKGAWKPVKLTVRLSGEAPHDLVVSYVVPMPTWKPAYRLVMDEASDRVLLQGWSVVDNLSGEDWIGARLSLTAGTPLAFKYDLYTPRDVERPDLTPSRYQVAEAPPPAMDATSRSAGGVGQSGPAGGGYLGGRARPYGRPSAPPPAAEYRRRARSVDADDDGPARDEATKEEAASSGALERSYRAQVTATTVGSLFRYDIRNRVTVPDRSSALVSIINQGVKGADVLYFLTDSGRSNPYRAVRFQNTTGYVLERGPITIYRKGAFVGEALGGRVEKDALSFVPYALEGRVILHQESRYEDEGMTLVKIDNGYLTVETQYVNKITYKVQNRTGEALTLYVSRPRRDGWTVVEPKGAVLERTVYYAPIPLKAEGETTFTVREQTPVRRTLSLWDSRARQAIGLYLRGAAVSPELAQKLKDVIELWTRLADVETQMSTLNGSIQMLRRREADVRENIRVLGTKANQDLRKKLAETLGTVEKELNGLNRKWVELNMQKGDLTQRIQVMLKMIKLG